MKKLQPLAIAVTLAVSAIGLTGCGDEGSANRVGSSAPAGAAIGSKAILIGNVGDQPFERIVLLDQTGNVLASQDIDCKPNQYNCLMYVQSDFNQPVTLVAQDKQGRMISAFQAKPGQLTREAIFPSAATTGFYLIDQLNKNYLAKQGVSLQQTVSDLQTFFKDYKGYDRGDIPVLLSEFIVKQRASGLTDSQILESLASRLKKHETAKSEELPTLKKKLKSNKNGGTALSSGGCPSALGWVMNVVGNVAEFFPIGGSIIKAGTGIGEFACDDSDGNFAKISASIAALQQSVDTIGNMLFAVKGMQELIEINAGLQRYSSAQSKVSAATAQYTSFLEANQVSSLDQFFNEKDAGGFRKTLDEFSTVRTIIDNMYDVISVTSATVVDHNNNSYFNALAGKCKSSQGYADTVNFLAVREWCNTAILGTTGYVISFKESLNMAKDIFTVLAKYAVKEGATVNNTVSVPVVNSTFMTSAKRRGLITDDKELKYSDYSKAFALTKKLFELEEKIYNHELVIAVGHDHLFKAYAGLPEGLTDNIKKVCPNIDKDGPSIVGWYTPTDKANNHFITTRCTSGGALAFHKDRVEERPLAKYYYSQGTNVRNVMGVLIKDDYPFTPEGGYVYDYDNLAGNSHYVAFYSDDLLAFALHQSAVPTDAKPEMYGGALNWYSVLENKTTPANKNYLKYAAPVGAPHHLLFKHTESADSVPEGDKIYYHHLLLLTGTPHSWNRRTLFVLNCVSSDCKIDSKNSSGLEFKKADGTWGGLKIDASYQNKYYGSENNYLYNLGRKKQ